MEAAAELARLLGGASVDADPDELRKYTFDMTPRAAVARRRGDKGPQPAAVVAPRTAAEVAATISWASDTSTPIVAFGGGSGVSGGIAPQDAVVVSTRHLDEIGEIDEKSLLVRVEAGMNGGVLERHLNERGYMLGHAPQSIEISTVGGWVATRACGQLSARYGGIEDAVAGLEAVLPDGTVAVSPIAPRTSTGPDTARLLIGSEGALGIVTAVTLRIHPRPEQRQDRCLVFEHMADGVAAWRSLAQSDTRPTLVRLYDREDAFVAFRSLDTPPDRPVLLLSFEGPHAESRADAALEGTGGSEFDTGLVTHWWEHRNDAARDYIHVMAGEGVLGPHAMVDTMEVSATWSRLRAVYHAMKESLSDEADICGCHLSHVYGDGACLYFTMASVCDNDDAALEANERWWRAGMSACLDNGGAPSHHHGIGRLKAEWLRPYLGPWWDVLVATKRSLDPNGIMNPGVLGL